jgi:hypothetical protein
VAGRGSGGRLCRHEFQRAERLLAAGMFGDEDDE